MDIVYYCLGFLGDPECEQLHNEFLRPETKKKTKNKYIKYI